MNSSVSDSKRYIVFGSTGHSGQEVVKQLAKNNKKVSICVRNIKKAEKIFQNIKDSIDNIYEMNDYSSEEEFKKLFNNFSEEENIDLVIISIIAYNGNTPRVEKFEMYRDQYLTNSLILKYSQQNKNVKKFVFVSSLFISRPEIIYAKYIEKVRPNALFYKSLLEFQIKNSGLNYLIIRPGKLEENKIEEPSEIFVSQGDKIGGLISYKTLGYAINSILNDSQNFEKNLSIDLCGPPHFLKQKINEENFIQKIRSLPEDNLIEIKQNFLIRNFQGHSYLNYSKNFGLGFIMVGLSFKLCAFILRKRFI